MKNTAQGDPAFTAFDQGREPVYVARFERHTREGLRPSRNTDRKGVHPYAVVIFLTAGRSRMQHAGALELRPGDVHLIPPGDAHAAAHFEQATGWALSFWPEQSEHSLRLFSQVRGGCHPVFRPSPAKRQRLEMWIEAMKAEHESHDEGRETALAALLKLVLVELVRADASPLRASTSDASSLARQALAFVEQNALKPLSLTDVARAVARTPAHLATVVRRETGRTVGEWILIQRMTEARRRLRATDAPIDEIAQQVGYADVTHFIRQFRRVHGGTPAHWRRAQGTSS